jgi:RHS repeat-associated protein
MGTTYYSTVNDEIIGEHSLGLSKLDYVTDGLGSVVATIDQTLTLQSTARYKPDGADLATSGTQPRFGWVGSQGYRKNDVSYSEFYVRARTYTSVAGCWTTADPLWPTERAYAYVSARPTKATDPSGLGPCNADITNVLGGYIATLGPEDFDPQDHADKLCGQCGACKCEGYYTIVQNVNITVDTVPTGVVSGTPCTLNKTLIDGGSVKVHHKCTSHNVCKGKPGSARPCTESLHEKWKGTRYISQYSQIFRITGTIRYKVFVSQTPINTCRYDLHYC